MFHLKSQFFSSDWSAFALTLFLMGLHYGVPWLRGQKKIPEPWIASFGGGFAVAYVFLHLLPGFVESNRTLGSLLSEQSAMSPLKDLMVYFMALAGFLFFFGLQRRVEGKILAERKPSRGDFYLHLAALLGLNFIITYTMPVRVQVSLDFALLFTAVMGLHSLILDRNLEFHYPDYFDRRGRFFLMLALLVGWILAAVTAPNNDMMVAMLTSFLGGSVLFGVFHNEIPPSGRSSFPAFAVGVAVGTLLLVLITVMKRGPVGP